jgi:hypothetical protein
MIAEGREQIHEDRVSQREADVERKKAKKEPLMGDQGGDQEG